MSDESRRSTAYVRRCADLPVQPPAWRGWAVFAAALAATFLLGLLAASILQRREEARHAACRCSQIGRWETGRRQVGRELSARVRQLPARWPTTTTQDQVRRRPSQRDYLAETPANVILFAGYGFAKDYKQARGHVHAIEDVTGDASGSAPTTPATCWTCKSPDVPRLMDELGAGEVLRRDVRRPASRRSRTRSAASTATSRTR